MRSMVLSIQSSFFGGSHARSRRRCRVVQQVDLLAEEEGWAQGSCIGMQELARPDGGPARPRARRSGIRNQLRPSISPSSFRKIFSEAGFEGRPGMVMISPQMTTTKPAPAESLTSRIGTVWPVGAPRRLGSVENEYWVLAMQTGRWP